MPRKNFFITTAIDYVNDKPHIGHALEKIQADVLARYHRQIGDNVFFLSGADENSLKNVRSAEKEGIKVEDLVKKNSGRFYKLKEVFNLSYDDFIRTTSEKHKNGAQKIWQACKKDIYKKRYKGLYCVGCEAFYKEEELENGLCPEHKTKPELVEEEDYFFNLSKYQNRMKEIIEDDQVKIIPESRKNEVLSFINSGLSDFCISRSAARAHGWGIDVPGDSSQKIWVWFDALSNYINALGYADNGKKFNEFWQGENKKVIHVIGKGILRFHAIYWLAMLISAGLKLPDEIFVHGYITVDRYKMSKSIGNVIDPFELAEKYDPEAIRYFLLREFSPIEDGDFSYNRFEERYNSDLASGLGNLVARVLTMAEKLKPEIEKGTAKEPTNQGFKKIISFLWEKRKNSLENFKFNDSLSAIWELVSFSDKYIEKNKTWQESNRQAEHIVNLLIALANIAEMIKPFLPKTSEKIFGQLGVKFEEEIWNFKINKGKPLFPRL